MKSYNVVVTDCSTLDFNIPFFDSSKQDYPDFDAWSRKVAAEPRLAYAVYAGE